MSFCQTLCITLEIVCIMADLSYKLFRFLAVAVNGNTVISYALGYMIIIGTEYNLL
jgi:hypothetical protein